MAEHIDFWSRGYSYHTATLYVYCDQCGSFSIRYYIGLRKWLLVVAAIGLVVTATLAAFKPGGHLYCLFVCLGICVLAFKSFWGDTDYVCRKCGHVPTTQYNTSNCPPDMSKVDVPEQWVQKRYLGYWPDMYDLDEALRPPVQPTPALSRE